MDKVRVLRIIEYVGTRDWIEETLKLSYVPLNGTKTVGKHNSIKSATVDLFPEILEQNVDVSNEVEEVDSDKPSDAW